MKENKDIKLINPINLINPIKIKQLKKIIGTLIVLVMAFSMTACSSAKGEKPVETVGLAMGTVITQSVYGLKAQQAADEVLVKIKQIEALMTANALSGDVHALNENAGKKSVKIHPETMIVLQEALKIAGLSEGAFDPTIGPVVKSWGIGSEQERIPEREDIRKLLSLVDYKDIIIDDQSVFLRRSGQMIDLGGIAKGYAGDIAREIYRDNNLTSAIINLGGNVVALGKKPDGSPWRIGVQDPRSENGQIVGFIEISDKAMVTSGDYQKYFEEEGKRYHHIMDPNTGYPAESDLMSVTLVADSSLQADELSTAVFVLGLEKGQKLLEKFNGAEAIFITSQKKIYVTNGLKDNFQLRSEMREYTYVEKE